SCESHLRQGSMVGRCQNFLMSDDPDCSAFFGFNMRRLVIIPLLAGLLLGVFCSAFAQEAPPGKSEDANGYAQISIFAKALELIRQDYVDDNKTSYHDLISAAMKGMLSSLDPHSQFMDPNDFRDMQDDTRSRFNGLGIEVSMKNGLPTVITAM